MAHLEISHGDYFLDDGRPLLRDISLRLGDGEKMALIGPNGVGKTTLIRILSGELALHAGSRGESGSIGIMKQFIGQVRDDSTVQDLLLGASSAAIAAAARNVAAREDRMVMVNDERSQMAYAEALVRWGDVGGYEEEIRWDEVTMSAIGVPYDRIAHRKAATLSGGEQKRLVLEALASGPHDILILDEPDNYLDVPGKTWLESLLRHTSKSVLFISHDREVIANASSSVATLERGPAGASLWVHGGSFASYASARTARTGRIDELRRRWSEDEQKLKDLVLMYREKARYNSDMATRYQAAQSRLERFRAEGPPEAPSPPEKLAMNLSGGRTAKRAVVCTSLELTGLMQPFDAEIWYGDRVAVLGSNGSGKSHFLRLLAVTAADDEEPEQASERSADLAPVGFEGAVRLGARVRPGYFVQTHDRTELQGRTLLDILHHGDKSRAGLARQAASSALGRYGLVRSAESLFDDLSGGQRARFQILLLELSGATLLLLDEPTDNLDVESAEALEAGLATFEGTVLAVTHDRWFARSFERFLVFGSDGVVYESPTPVWDEGRVQRGRTP
jgi:ATPase subunit of ABC transporter with duplicated ATPase domains